MATINLFRSINKQAAFSKKSIVESITALIVFLFLYTGLNKYIDNQNFQVFIHESPLIKPFSVVVAKTLPGFEIFISALLIFPKTRLWGFYLSLGLMVIFTLYLIYMVTFSSVLPCRCGGVINKLSWKQHIFFNLFFVGISLIGLIIQKKINKGREDI